MTTLLTGGGTRGRDALDDDVDLARDRDLVTRAQGGDRTAFDDLYMRYYRRLFRFCLRRLQDSHEAEDVAQEAFARAWRALPTFGGDRRFYPWLSVIASHLCTDVLRRRSRSTPVAEFHQGNVASTEDSGEDLMVAAVDSELVARAFTRLSDRHQRILHLREGSGWSYQRIADHEGVGITAVETLLWRARQALKREFASLAGAESRMAAVIGGIFSVATLRKLLHLPKVAAKRAAATGAKGGAIAAGSAVAATAMVIGATLSAPTHDSVVPRDHVPAISQELAGINGNSSPVAAVIGVPTGGGGLLGGGTVSSGSTNIGSSTSNGSAPGASGLPGLSNLPGNLNGTLGNVVNNLGQTVNGVTGDVNNILNSVTGGSLSGITGGLGQPLSGVTSLLGGSGGSATATGAGTATATGTSNVAGTVSGLVNTTTNSLKKLTGSLLGG